MNKKVRDPPIFNVVFEAFQVPRISVSSVLTDYYLSLTNKPIAEVWVLVFWRNLFKVERNRLKWRGANCKLNNVLTAWATQVISYDNGMTNPWSFWNQLVQSSHHTPGRVRAPCHSCWYYHIGHLSWWRCLLWSPPSLGDVFHDVACIDSLCFATGYGDALPLQYPRGNLVGLSSASPRVRRCTGHRQGRREPLEQWCWSFHQMLPWLLDGCSLGSSIDYAIWNIQEIRMRFI